MKNIILMLVVIGMIFVSCNKEEKLYIPVDTEAIRSQLASLPAPTKEEIQIRLSEPNTLKSANIEPVLTRIFPLDQNTYEVYEDHAVKHFVLYQLNQNAYRNNFITLNQSFKIVNGIIDTTQYQLDMNVGCPFNRYFQLKDQNNINKLTFFFHFNNGEEFAYFGDINSNSGVIKLPPIAGGQWQIDIVYYDGDTRQEYMSNLINFYEDNFITLKFNILPKENVKSVLEINKSFINPDIRYIQVSGQDEEGNNFYFIYPINLDGLDENIKISTPFMKIVRVYLCGDNGCWLHEVRLSPLSPFEGNKIYVLR